LITEFKKCFIFNHQSLKYTTLQTWGLSPMLHLFDLNTVIIVKYKLKKKTVFYFNIYKS